MADYCHRCRGIAYSRCTDCGNPLCLSHKSGDGFAVHVLLGGGLRVPVGSLCIPCEWKSMERNAAAIVNRLKADGFTSTAQMAVSSAMSMGPL